MVLRRRISSNFPQRSGGGPRGKKGVVGGKDEHTSKEEARGKRKRAALMTGLEQKSDFSWFPGSE